MRPLCHLVNMAKNPIEAGLPDHGGKDVPLHHLINLGMHAGFAVGRGRDDDDQGPVGEDEDLVAAVS